MAEGLVGGEDFGVDASLIKADASRYAIGGSHGSLSIPDLRLRRNGQAERHRWSPMEVECLAHETSDPLVSQIDHFAAVIANKASPLASAAEDMRSLQVDEAIQMTVLTGHVVDLERL